MKSNIAAKLFAMTLIPTICNDFLLLEKVTLPTTFVAANFFIFYFAMLS
jgi:hypothetical protein